MRTAKEIMEVAYKTALLIVHDNAPHGTDAGSATIASSNLAIAIFSYEVEMEAMKNSQQNADESFDTGGEDNG